MYRSLLGYFPSSCSSLRRKLACSATTDGELADVDNRSQASDFSGTAFLLVSRYRWKPQRQTVRALLSARYQDQSGSTPAQDFYLAVTGGSDYSRYTM